MADGMQKLATGIVVALLSVGVAVAANGQPKQAFTAADQALARSIVLHRADLPAGFRSTASSGNLGKLPRCRGFNPTESDLTLRGRASSPNFDVAGNPPLVSSAVDVWLNATQARTTFNRVVRPALSGCLLKLFAQGLKANAPKGVRYVPVSHTLRPLTGLGQQAAIVQLVFTGISGSTHIALISDYFAIRKGRVTALITTLDLGTPYARGRLLAARLASRMP